MKQWLELLETEAKLYSTVFVIVDGLNELEDSSGQRQELFHQLRMLESVACLMVTSRPHPQLERKLPPPALVQCIARGHDVRLYLEQRLDKELRLSQQLSTNPNLRATIISRVIDVAQGVSQLLCVIQSQVLTETSLLLGS